MDRKLSTAIRTYRALVRDWIAFKVTQVEVARFYKATLAEFGHDAVRKEYTRQTR